MGLTQVSYDEERLSNILNIDADTLRKAMSESRRGGKIAVWSFEDKGTYGVVNISTQKAVPLKDGEPEPRYTFRDKSGVVKHYTTDFYSKFARVVGQAYEYMKSKPPIPEKASLDALVLNVEVTTSKGKDDKYFTNCVIYKMEDAPARKTARQPSAQESPTAPKPAPKPAAQPASNKGLTGELPF